MSVAWWRLLRRLLVFLLGALLLGALVGQWQLALGLAASAALVWQLWQLYQLERWLNSGSQAMRPSRAGAVWNGVFDHVMRLRRQSRKRKRKLGRLLEQFQQATAALPDAAVLLDDDNRLLWCNAASRRLLGLDMGRDSGRPITHLLRYPGFVAFLGPRREPDSIEFPAPVDDGLLLSARIVPYGKKQRLLLATDVSRVRRLEQMRREFVANVSHELRTPLTVISGYLETLLDSDDPALEVWRQPLRGMQQQAGRMLHIIEDLLMLARLESQRERSPRRPVAVPTLLADIADDAVALSGEQNHCIELQADQGLWLLGCEKELRSAFSNLVFNAVRYTPAEGRIEIRWFADDSGLHLVVADTGEGIAPHHIPRLTERFYRINRDRSRISGGTGLGLSIVKHVLNNHGGQLHITSEVGVGSVFSCDFAAELRATPPVAPLPCRVSPTGQGC
ncbi:MAG TPA: phosphate regulon sensor histidine kinase PhoR [Candidatus Competibacteraceae bacterium]|nr:MAG: phosphate regulon sensor histidine kinase PhoR [Candidatus Competibacteraceae bacterium]HQC71813.1 phosphate regulon sensor histidine kinase PhoR [Candidatus Competibacteraceae bacterium]